jgi:hypothetical protein
MQYTHPRYVAPSTTPRENLTTINHRIIEHLKLGVIVPFKWAHIITYILIILTMMEVIKLHTKVL